MKQTTSRSDKYAKILETALRCAGNGPIDDISEKEIFDAAFEFPMFVKREDFGKYRRGIMAALTKSIQATATEDGKSHPGFNKMYTELTVGVIKRFFDEATYEKSLALVRGSSR